MKMTRSIKTACAIFALSVTMAQCGGGPQQPSDILEFFKYGAFGTEARAGVPYWIWRVLPIVFADKLPHRPGQGWEKLGFIYESKDRDHPIGTTHTKNGLPAVRRTRDGILDGARDNAWFDKRPPQGPGRVDTFNPYKVMFKFDIGADDTVGTVDLPSLWNQRVRRNLWLHWDGNNNLVEERNKSAAIGAGATPESLDVAALKRIEDWIMDLKPPSFPAERIDPMRAARGRVVYSAECASCHELGSKEIGQVTKQALLGTDPERVRSFTPELAVRMNTLGEGYPWRFSHFRKTDGYANMPLDGLWLRAPYLHNGSVPTLRALLFPEQRPSRFYRAYDVYDWNNVGFVSSGPDAEHEGVLYDTGLKGNSNVGHVYGRQLTADQREDLLEYLKTL